MDPGRRRPRFEIDISVNQICVGNRYIIMEKVGSGSFGEVFTGIDLITGDTVAVKVESQTHTSSKQLEIEKCVYENVDGVNGIPRLRWFGQVVLNSRNGEMFEHDVIVLDFLGPSLEDLKQKFKTFNLATTLVIAEQILQTLGNIHQLFYIHRDIKPDNFLMGPAASSKQFRVFIVDFGLARLYRKGRKHVPFRKDRPLTGTVRYASVNSHRGHELSRRDDLESLGYVLIYFLKGRLPWQGIIEPNVNARYRRIGEMKAKINLEELCEGLPSQFLTFMNYSRSLKFEDNPDYNYLSHLFRSLRRVTPGEILQIDWNTVPRAINRKHQTSTAGNCH